MRTTSTHLQMEELFQVQGEWLRVEGKIGVLRVFQRPRMQLERVEVLKDTEFFEGVANLDAKNVGVPCVSFYDSKGTFICGPAGLSKQEMRDVSEKVLLLLTRLTRT